MPPRDRIRAISFDADGTLWDFRAVMRRSLVLVLDELAGLEPRAAEWGVDGLIAIRDQVAAEWPGRRHEEVRRESFRRALARLGRPDEALAAQLSELYLRHRFQDIALYDDVRPALAALQDRYVLGIVSNGNSYPERCGLPGAFRFAVYAQDHGAAKPDPRLFRIALAEAGCAPEEMLHVGDSWEDDVLGARAAGLLAVWLNRDGAPRPDAAEVREVRSLAELPSALAGFPPPDEADA